VLGGQLLDENVVQEDLAASTGSKKGLFLAIAAAVLLSIGGGAWYYQKYYSRTTTVAPARPASIPSSAAPTHVSELPPVRNDSNAGINMANPALPTASAALSKSSKNPEPVASQAVFKPAPESKNAEPNPRTAPPAEPQRKPSLGDVHLATPVVNRGTASPQAAVALPSLQIDASPAGSDPLAAVESIQHKELVAPRPVGGDVKTAQLLKSVAPVYPPLARAQRISGNVQIDAFIDASGNVASVKVISGPPVLHNSALEAVKQWKYSPALLDGQPTSMHLTVVVQFRTQ
jgi:protein TonB